MDTRTRWPSGRLAVAAAIATAHAVPGAGLAQAATTTLYAAPTGSGTACSVIDTDPTLEYSGTWGVDSGRGFGDFGDDVHYSLVNGDSVTATWVGTGIDVVTERNADQGDLDVYVDGQFRQTVNTSSATRLVQQKVFGIDGLTPGVHTVKLVKKSGQYAVIDRFTVR